MANHKSAEKANRQAVRRTLINRNRMTRIRTFVRKALEAIASKDQAVALVAVRQAESEIQSGVSKGIIHRNAASRKVSRLTKHLKALAAS